MRDEEWERECVCVWKCSYAHSLLHQQNYFALSWKFNKITFHSVCLVFDACTNQIPTIFTIDTNSEVLCLYLPCMHSIVYLYLCMRVHCVHLNPGDSRFATYILMHFMVNAHPALFTQTSRVNPNTNSRTSMQISLVRHSQRNVQRKNGMKRW